MSNSLKWIVCEESGRWSAAMRIAWGRSSDDSHLPRIYELRTLAELAKEVELADCLALIEVGRSNLNDVLEFLRRGSRRRTLFVGLLHETADQPEVAELLWEAGAADIVESPRRLRGLWALHERISSVAGPAARVSLERESFTDWAWSTLPWQET